MVKILIDEKMVQKDATEPYRRTVIATTDADAVLKVFSFSVVTSIYLQLNTVLLGFLKKRRN